MKRALDTEPTLKRYLVALPYDLPAGDTTTAKGRTGRVRLHPVGEEEEPVGKPWPPPRAMDVEFVFVGQSDLTDALTSKVENAGRGPLLVRCVRPVHEGAAGPAQRCDRCSRTPLHPRICTCTSRRPRPSKGWAAARRGFTRSRLRWPGVRRARTANWRAPDGDPALADLLAAALASLDAADLALVTLARSGRDKPVLCRSPNTRSPPPGRPWTPPPRQLRSHADSQGIYRGPGRHDGPHHPQGPGSSQGRCPDAAQWRDRCRPGAGVLLMTGRAGVGKTHLFCDIASRRIDDEQPDRCPARAGLRRKHPDAADRQACPRSKERLMRSWQSSTPPARRQVVPPCSWSMPSTRVPPGTGGHTTYRGLVVAVDRCPNVVLAVSCRTEFVEPVVGTLRSGHSACGAPRFRRGHRDRCRALHPASTGWSRSRSPSSTRSSATRCSSSSPARR